MLTILYQDWWIDMDKVESESVLASVVVHDVKTCLLYEREILYNKSKKKILLRASNSSKNS